MAISISLVVAQLAQMSSQSTGLDQNVILAHWNAEEGVSSVSQWPNNNPAGIRPGNSSVDKLASGVSSAGFNVFPTPAAGAEAYATLINTDRNYAGVRVAARSGNPTLQLSAIVQSPWDAGHYGGDGHLLYNSYTTITGKNVGFIQDAGLANQSYNYAPDNADQLSNSIVKQVDFPVTDYGIVANSQRTGNVLYGRRYRVIVSNKSGIGLDVSDLHCQFSIVKTINQPPNESTVVIYNLNPVTENFIIMEGDRVTVEAGYEGSQYGVIFDGDVVQPIRDKPDNTTFRLRLFALDSRLQLNQAFVNFTVSKGQNARSMIENLTSKATVPTQLGDISQRLSTQTLPRGKAVFGLTRDYLRQIAQANNMTFYAENGLINFVHAADPPKGEIIELSPTTGLVGQPAQQEQGITFKCLLNPSIQIGSMVHIDNSLIQLQQYQPGVSSTPPKNLDSAGIYRVVGLTHNGDTRDTDWYTECVAISQAGGIPSMMSGIDSNPW